MNENPPIKVCACIRASTDMQPTSLKIQREGVGELAKKHNYEIIKWYKDEARSGSRQQHKRDGLAELLADAPTAEWTVVLCLNLSRFSRLDIIDDAQLVQVLRNNGKSIHSVEDGFFDWRSSSGRIMYLIRREHTHDLSQTLAFNVARGKLNSFLGDKTYGQRCPYGMARFVIDPQGATCLKSRREIFRRPKGWFQEFVPAEDPMEVETVQWLFTTYATMDVSFTYLAGKLNKKKISAPYGGKWRANVVGRLLRQDIYVGDIRLGKEGCGDFARIDGKTVIQAPPTRQRERKTGIVRHGVHKGIIERELWNRVQQKLAVRSELKIPQLARGEGGFPLKGVLVCSGCGHFLSGVRPRKPNGSVLYVCKSGCSYGREVSCPEWSVREDDVLPLVIEKLTSLVADAVLADRAVKEAQRVLKPKHSPIAALERKRDQLKRTIQIKAKRLLDYDPDLHPELQAALKEFKAELAQVEERIRQMQDGEPSLTNDLLEWERWLADDAKRFLHLRTSPETGTELDGDLVYTPDTFRQTLHDFGCRVTCWWREKDRIRWQVDRIRIQLGVKDSPAPEAAEKDAQSEPDRSLYGSDCASPIDRVFSLREFYRDRSYPVILPLMREMRAKGATMKAIADHLNGKGLTTVAGTLWNKDKVWTALFGKEHYRQRASEKQVGEEDE